ncbi:MAG: GxxExxY protein [Syntrophomonadaceae bacterium]|nr:GxxExxY protein [Syntrophomonadaceae bacterium]
MKDNYLYSDLTEKIIGCAYKVFDKLGSGFLEKVYENALKIELEKNGFKVIQQYPIKVFYDDTLVGEYFADLLVEDKIIIELKAATELSKAHETQLINYLRSTGYQVGILINFGDKLTIRRKVMTANYKGSQRKS